MQSNLHSSMESLLNSIHNDEVDDACTHAEYILKQFSDHKDYASVGIDDLKLGFSLDSPRLHRSLARIVARSACNLDFASFVDMFTLILKENSRKDVLAILAPILITELVPKCCTAADLVQSHIFPFLIIHLSNPEISTVENITDALIYLVSIDAEAVLLIDKHLTVFLNKHDSIVYARIITIRVTLAVLSKNQLHLRIIADSLFRNNQNDVLLMANIIEVCEAAIKSPQDVSTLVDSGVIDHIIRILSDHDELCDVAIGLFIKCVNIDLNFVSRISQLFNEPRIILHSKYHPSTLQLELSIFKFNGDRLYAESVVNAARNETGMRQLNAFIAMNRLISDETNVHNQKVYFDELFVDIFDFIASQLPLKGDLVMREAMYSLLETAISKEWLTDRAIKCSRLHTFLLDRSMDSSLTGLQTKYRMVKFISSLPNLSVDLKARFNAFLSEGVNGRFTPMTNVASQYNQ